MFKKNVNSVIRRFKKKYNNLCYIFLDIPTTQIRSTANVIFGSDTRLDCFVSGYPPPYKVEWQASLDGTTFDTIDIYKNKYFGSSTDQCSPFLRVRKASLTDQQYYQVVVWNVFGKCTSNNVFLQVTGGLYINSCVYFRKKNVLTIDLQSYWKKTLFYLP